MKLLSPSRALLPVSSRGETEGSALLSNNSNRGVLKVIVTLTLVFAVLPLSAATKRKPFPTLVKQAPQTAEIPNLEVPTPKQSCPNWAWAVAVQLMLEKQKVVDYPQTYWILKSAPGELCIDSPVDLADLKHWIDGNYKLMDGNDAHFEAVVVSGPPQDVGYLIRLLRDGVPPLILYGGRPLVLQAVEYDEYIYPNNQRMYEARKLTMIDPVSRQPVVFEKLKDNADRLGGVLEVKVGPVEHWK
jgi:hypothetical protein